MSGSILLKSSITKKYWMSLTGFFLILFLVGHLLGNLQLLISDTSIARDQFNEYALFMTSNPVVVLLSYLTYLSIIFHAVDGLLLTVKNRRARGKVDYVKYKGKASATWASRNMGLLGSVILVFLVVHMNMYWAKLKFGALDETLYETSKNGLMVKDLYTLTVKSFQDPSFGLFWLIFYALSMLALGYHLSHGFASASNSLGIRHPKLNRIIKLKGLIIAILIPLLYAFIPFYIRYFIKII